MIPIHQLGRDTEDRALKWYLDQGRYHLLVRNYRCRWGEIDLIFEEVLPNQFQVDLVFVEVRSRSHDRGWTGAESIGVRKQRRLQRAIRHFLSRYRGGATQIRLDLLYWDGKAWSLLRDLWLDENSY